MGWRYAKTSEVGARAAGRINESGGDKENLATQQARSPQDPGRASKAWRGLAGRGANPF